MGAYFQTQIQTKEGKAVVYPVGGLKFLESFFFRSIAQQAILLYLRDFTDCLNPVVIRTVCDYDTAEDGLWIIHGQKNKEIERFKRRHNQTLINHGFVVCPETKTAINLELVAKRDNSKVICPLALLTRLSGEYQGGGDIDIENPYIGTWYGKPVYFIDDELPSDITDITLDILVKNKPYHKPYKK